MPIRDAERLKEKIELSLDSRQVFFLFFGAAVGACLVFVLGVMVGKRLEERAQVAGRAVSSAAIDPLAALDELSADEANDELAFPMELAGKAAAKKASENAKAHAAKFAAQAKEDEQASADEAAKKAGEDKSATNMKSDSPADSDGDSHPSPAANEKKGATNSKPEGKGEESSSDAKGSKDKESKSKTASAKSGSDEATKSRFTLQISSFQNKADAKSFVAELKRDGYHPYVQESVIENRGLFYRVRLGRFASYDDAIAAKAAFEKKKHTIAYVTRM